MTEKFLHTICCTSCGYVLSKSFEGTKSYVRCPKCQADFFIEVGKNGPTIILLKEPKNLPNIPPVPA